MHEYVVVVGGANVDIKGRIAGSHQGATSHPGLIWRTAGGVGRNIAANVSALECSVRFIAPVGDDEDGEYLLNDLIECNVDVSHVLRVRSHPTGRYIAIFGSNGELEVAVSDMSIMDVLSPTEVKNRIDAFREARVVCVDANLAPGTIGATLEIAKALDIVTVVQTVSVEKSSRIAPFLQDIHTMTPNRDELGALAEMPVSTISEVAKAAQSLQTRGVRRVVVTLGAEGVLVAHEAATEHFPTHSVPVIDATGAGDAFTAGVVCGYCRNMTIPNMVRLGQSLASRILTSTESVLKGSFL